MYNTKPALPEMTRAAEQFADRQGYSPGGSRVASMLLSPLQNLTARTPPSQSSWFSLLSLGL
jgi:hypothetical protein